MKKGILFLCAASLAAFVFAAAPRELNGYDFYPAGADAKPFAGDFGKLPTGAREFEVELPRGKGAVVNAADFGLNERVENAATIINSEARSSERAVQVLRRDVDYARRL